MYICQPPLTYNGRAVYVGHATGSYVYYYDVPGAKQKGEKEYAPGWCLSRYLGNGAPGLRLDVEEALNRDPCAARAEPPRRLAREASFWMSSWWQRLKSALDARASRDAVDTEDPEHLLPVPPEAPAEDGTYPQPPEAERNVSFAHAGLDSGSEASAPPDAPALRRVAHTTSLLTAAASSGDAETVRYAVGLYKERYADCLTWQYAVAEGLWAAYPPYVQGRIAEADRRGLRRVVVRGSDDEAVVLDLLCLRHEAGGAACHMRCVLPTLFQHRDGGEWGVTADPAAVRNWDQAAVLQSAGAVASVAPDKRVLSLLTREGVVDPFLWTPACKHREARGWRLPSTRPPWFEEVLHEYVARAFDAPRIDECVRRRVSTAPDADADAGPGTATGPRRGGARFTDGLAVPASTPTSPFYDAAYRSDVGTLPFCLALPDNTVGLWFSELAVTELCVDAVLKVYELGRQRAILGPLQILPIYVYTYELSGDGAQIYESMNTAMRENSEAGIAFWRPLIWQVDCVLLLLPPYKGRLYRGISMRFSSASYKAGQQVCWPAFSSSSITRAVAEDFVRGGDGTLFFLTSVDAARAISMFSRYPDEDEVACPPHATWSSPPSVPAPSPLILWGST